MVKALNVMNEEMTNGIKIHIRGEEIDLNEIIAAAFDLKDQYNDVKSAPTDLVATITAVNGKVVKNLADFYSELANAEKSVNFDVYTNGGTITTGTYRF